MNDDLTDTLRERGERYGPFSGHARVAQKIKLAIREELEANRTFAKLTTTGQAVALESLDMIAHKIGRIVNGDPTYADSWHDIGGYARLAEQFFEPEEKK